MRALRRLLQVVALVGTLMVGVVAVSLIVSQTPWFKDWLRRYIVRESKQYLNGELTIGRLGGNLFFGVDLRDVAVNVSGERVVAVKGLEVDYNFLTFISRGIVVDDIKLVAPEIHVERDKRGWNLGRLVKEQRKEADREGPGRPISLPSIEIADASVYIDDRVGANGYRLPEQIRDLDLKASYEYEPVHYSVVVDRASFRTNQPQFALSELTGSVAVRDDNLYVESLSIKTAESTLTLDGVVEQYLKTPIVRMTTTGDVSLPEIGRVIPAASGYALKPAFSIKASGPAEQLQLDLDVKSEAGNVRGALTADVHAPDFAASGKVDLDHLNLAPLLKNPAQRSDLTGRAELDVRMASAPAGAPVTDRMSGTFNFKGPRVTVAGYSAADVDVSGRFNAPRIEIDGRASAYGGAATASGFVVPPADGRALAFDVRGQADNLDLRNLPPETGAPKLATDLSVAQYHVAGSGQTIKGSALMNRSTVEGATIEKGLTAEFGTDAKGITYAARGSVADVNLQRIGRTMKIAALDKPGYDSDVNADFDVKGSMPRTNGRTTDEARMKGMAVDATGTIRDSTILGGRLPQLAFEAHLANGALNAQADGQFEGFNPATVAGRKDLEGKVTGTVNVRAQVADISAPITPSSVTADGIVSLANSQVAGLQIDSATVEGQYANQVGEIAKLQVASPDLKVDASGRVALDRTSASNLKYHIEAANLEHLASLAGQKDIKGSAVLDGTVTGNASSLQTRGTLDGSGLGQGENTALDLNSTYTVTVAELDAKNAAVEATTTATFVKAGGLEISSLTATTTYQNQKIEFATSVKEKTRELDAKGEIILHPDHQEIHLPEMAIRTQGVEWRTAGTEAAIRYGKERIELANVRLMSGDQSLDVSGTLAMKADSPAGALKADLKNVDLQQLQQLTLQDRGLSGRLSASATVSGSAAAPIVDGHVEIRDGAFRNYKYQSLVADVDFKGQRLDLDAKLQQSPTEHITATGTVPMSLFSASERGGHVPGAAEDRVDVAVKSTALNLGVVQGFTTMVTNVTGTLEADIRVTGSGEDPHLEGFVDIKGGAFGVPLGGVSYTGLDTRIELAPDTVRLEKFSILDEHGEQLTVSGELAVHARQVGAVNINIESDNFEVIDNELGDVGVDSQLKITGELRRPQVVGEVRLEAARLEVDKLLQLFYDPYAVEALPDVVSAERSVEGSGSAEDAAREALARAQGSAAAPAAEKDAAEPAPAPGGIGEAIALDVRLRIPDNLVLRGKDLRPGGPTGTSLGDVNLTVGTSGDLRILKQPSSPISLVGAVQTVRGSYQFQGRRFDLVRGGTLQFRGETEFNPALDITATREIPNTGVTATVRVTGTAKVPQLRLTSTPPLEESDILALIVFNRPVNELGTGERSSLAATAGGIATGFIAEPLGESIGKALDLDLFEITTTTEDGELGAGVTLGQQVGDRAFFKMRQQFGDRNVTEFLLEYALMDYMRVESTFAPESSGSANRIGQRRIERAGIDLIFFFSY
jgi:autotransporter translocation and assembly factor TamB